MKQLLPINPMHFQTEEYYFKDSPWKKGWEFFRGILLIFYAPFAYGKHLINKMHGIVDPEPRIQGAWQEHSVFENLIVLSHALNDEDAEKLYESDTLDFPYWKDWDDPFRYLLKFKTEPKLVELETMYFDEVGLVTERGIYLIRINEKGMSLCFISAPETKLYEITHLKPLSWIIEQIDHTTVQLTGYSDKGMHLIKVKTGYNNRIKQGL